MTDYWNGRYLAEGPIWGYEPSGTVRMAMKWFDVYGVENVLVPGAGYGRNTKALSARYKVDAVEVSPDAVRQGEQWDPLTRWIKASVFEYDSGTAYDAVFCYDVLHLFLLPDRRKLIQNCVRQTREGGILFFTCFSDQDPHYGVGNRLEEGTYEYQTGKFSHFFSEEDLLSHFEGLKVLECGSVNERLQYAGGGNGKEYILRYAAVQR